MLTGRARDQPSARSPFACWTALPSTPQAPGLARRFLAGSLSAESLQVYDIAVLLTSELVANAVLHGQDPIRLQLRRSADTLRVEVSDGGHLFDRPQTGVDELTDEGGRGLHIISALASSWGSQTTGAGTEGKTVWFEVSRRDACAAP